MMEFSAYLEGWGLYCEWFGTELGFYTDPMQDFGRLNAEIWRSVRLVVDTGLHSLKWTREQAEKYMADNTFLAPVEIQTEVARYCVYPGQALSYKVGMISMRDINLKAKKELGDKFHYPDFHDMVLGKGALPLYVFEKNANEWIKNQKS